MLRRNRLGRPTRLPHPIADTHLEAFASGLAVGAVLALAAAVILWKSGALGLIR